MDPSVEFYAGCLSGLAQNVIGHPFDTLKVYIQYTKSDSNGEFMERVWGMCSTGNTSE